MILVFVDNCYLDPLFHLEYHLLLKVLLFLPYVFFQLQNTADQGNNEVAKHSGPSGGWPGLVPYLKRLVQACSNWNDPLCSDNVKFQ